MSLTSDTVLILIGSLFLLIGLLGGGIEISAIKVPTAGAPQRAVLGLIGVVLIAVGVVTILWPSSNATTAAAAEAPAVPIAASAADASASAGEAATPGTDATASAPSAAPAASEGGQ